MIYVLDASAAIALVRGEKGGEIVSDVLGNRGFCYIHPVNWIELHYKIRQNHGLEQADATTARYHRAGLIVPEISGDDFRRRVSAIKCSPPPLSLADCHAVALAELLGGTVVTSDRRMSDASAIAGILQIR